MQPLPAQDPMAAAALARNDRYLLEFVEPLNICPFARLCRESKKLRREVFAGADPTAEAMAARIKALDAFGPDEVEVALLVLPEVTWESRPFERWVSAVRSEYERGRQGPVVYFMVGFHPGLPRDLLNADRAVTFMRRSPDPTVQLIRASVLDHIKETAHDRRALSRSIAEGGLATVQREGPDKVEAHLASMKAR